MWASSASTMGSGASSARSTTASAAPSATPGAAPAASAPRSTPTAPPSTTPTTARGAPSGSPTPSATPPDSSTTPPGGASRSVASWAAPRGGRPACAPTVPTTRSDASRGAELLLMPAVPEIAARCSLTGASGSGRDPSPRRRASGASR
jgi:hypothetical protein